MWINTQKYIALEKQVAAQSATIEWLRETLNYERQELATLKQRALGFAIPVPTIESAQPAGVSEVRIPISDGPSRVPSARDIFSGNIGFEDMGDEEAQRQGVDWDPYTGLPRHN